MNEHYFDSDKNSRQLPQNSRSSNLELVNDFQAIINLISKSLGVTVGLIALINHDRLFIHSNHQSLNGKTINFKETIFEQSLSSQILNLKKVFIKEINEEEKTYASMPLVSTTGEIIGFLAVIDSSPRDFGKNKLSLLEDFAKITEETFNKYNAAQKLQEVFTDFVHKTVHDLKNPFTTISLTTELLKKQATNANLVISFSQRLENANNKVLKNLERLKSAFPLTSHTFILNIQEIDIDELFTQVKQQIKHKVTTDHQLADKIYGDYHRLAEAIVQLTNHLSLISENMKHLTLKAYTEKNNAIIEVSNANGEEDLKDFEDTNNSTALAIAKKLAQMHNGNITVTCHETSAYYSCYISLPLLAL